MRRTRLFLGVFALALLMPLLLLACVDSGELADGPSSEPTTAKEEGVSWIFKETIPLFDTSLINRFPTVNWERVTYLLYWSLRISVFALLVLLFIVSRIRKSCRPAAGYPQVPEGLTTLPSDLPAPAVSVLGSRKVGPQTYLSILVDMLQKGNLTITGGYGDSDKKRRLHSRVWFTRQFEPDQPWEKEVYSALPFLSASDLLKPNSDMLKSKFEGRRKAIGTHLDECLRSRGIFDEPPLQVMADRSQGWVVKTAWVLATVILAVGVGLWVNLWLPWWAGAAIGIPIAVVFLVDYAFDKTSGRLNPTPAGALEISQWWSFAGSIRDGLVSPSLDPSQPDPMLPYAVALNEARQWITNSNALPPWFLPDGPREQTRQGLYAAYRGFMGADSWDLDGGPKRKSSPFRDWLAQSAGKQQGGWSGPGGDAAGDGGG